VGRVGGVGAIDPAGDDDPDGRLALLHDADLDGGGVGAEKDVAADVEGVEAIAGGVVGGDVEGIEVVVFEFDLGAFDGLETEPGEDLAELGLDLAEWVFRADRAAGSGDGDVVGGGGGQGFDTLEEFALGGEGFEDCGLDLVGECADGAALFGRQVAEFFRGLLEGTAASEDGGSCLVECLRGVGGLDEGQGLLADFLEFFAHRPLAPWRGLQALPSRAMATKRSKASGSETAISASILRLSWTLAFWMPWMNWL